MNSLLQFDGNQVHHRWRNEILFICNILIQGATLAIHAHKILVGVACRLQGLVNTEAKDTAWRRVSLLLLLLRSNLFDHKFSFFAIYYNFWLLPKFFVYLSVGYCIIHLLLLFWDYCIVSLWTVRILGTVDSILKCADNSFAQALCSQKMFIDLKRYECLVMVYFVSQSISHDKCLETSECDVIWQIFNLILHACYFILFFKKVYQLIS